MPTCNIVVNFKATRLDWVLPIPEALPDYKKCMVLFEPFWSHLESLGGNCWQNFFELVYQDTNTIGASLTIEGDAVEVVLLVGSQGFDVAEKLLCVLHMAGYSEIEALVYTDECDYIEDEDGEAYPVGTLFTVDETGVIQESDYPEVEYEYYD